MGHQFQRRRGCFLSYCHIITVWFVLVVSHPTVGVKTARPTRVPGSPNIVTKADFPYIFWKPTPGPYTPSPRPQVHSSSTRYLHYHGNPIGDYDMDVSESQMLPIQIPKDIVGDALNHPSTTTRSNSYPTSATPQYGRHPGRTDPPPLYHPEGLYEGHRFRGPGKEDIKVSKTEARHPNHRYPDQTQGNEEYDESYIQNLIKPQPSWPESIYKQMEPFLQIPSWATGLLDKGKKPLVKNNINRYETKQEPQKPHEFFSISGSPPNIIPYIEDKTTFPTNTYNYDIKIKGTLSPVPIQEGSFDVYPAESNSNSVQGIRFKPSVLESEEQGNSNYDWQPNRIPGSGNTKSPRVTYGNNFQYENEASTVTEYPFVVTKPSDEFILPGILETYYHEEDIENPVRKHNFQNTKTVVPPKNYVTRGVETVTQESQNNINIEYENYPYHQSESTIQTRPHRPFQPATKRRPFRRPGIPVRPINSQRRPYVEKNSQDHIEYSEAFTTNYAVIQEDQPVYESEQNIDSSYDSYYEPIRNGRPNIKLENHEFRAPPPKNRPPNFRPQNNRPSKTRPAIDRIQHHRPQTRPKRPGHKFGPRPVPNFDIYNIDRFSDASVSSTLAIPGSMLIVAMGLALFYFNFVWYPTPVVTARLAQMISNKFPEHALNDDQQKVVGKMYEVFRGLESQTTLDHAWTPQCRSRLVCQVHEELPGLWKVTSMSSIIFRTISATRPGGNTDVGQYMQAAERGSNGQDCMQHYNKCAIPDMPIKDLVLHLVGLLQDHDLQQKEKD